jgi:TetR/AcrR family transcriptional regulator, transcriptional repressor for nem operon
MYIDALHRRKVGELEMRVTKAQVQINRAHMLATASTLFRERGYDGVGVADLMAAAGFTHGGFYRHFRSKAGLMVEAAASGLSQTVANNEGLDVAEFFKRYVSREHRDARSVGCTMAALCGDAARQSENIRATFAAGIESMLVALDCEGTTLRDVGGHKVRAKMIDMLAHAIGAVVLSRACPDDSPLSDEILDVCRTEIVGPLVTAGGAM